MSRAQSPGEITALIGPYSFLLCVCLYRHVSPGVPGGQTKNVLIQHTITRRTRVRPKGGFFGIEPSQRPIKKRLARTHTQLLARVRIHVYRGKCEGESSVAHMHWGPPKQAFHLGGWNYPLLPAHVLPHLLAKMPPRNGLLNIAQPC